ncbi:MAG: tetratricopeptide repeat-containing glycosyltransferase family protein [Pseudomonadota bacterium]
MSDTAEASRDEGPARSEAPRKRRISAAELRARAIKAHQAGELDEAFAAYRLYLRAKPRDAGIWTNLGALHRKRGQHAVAAAAQRRAAALAPEDASILSNLGNALQDADRLDEALQVRGEVLRRRPDDPEAHAMLAVTLRSLARFEEAAEICDGGLRRSPGHAELRVQKAMALLALGRYAQGFELFESRWDIGEIDKPDYPEPEWDGADPAGKRLLVLPEQGNGDTLLMTRFLPGLKALGAHVTLAVKPGLARLMQGIEGADRVLVTGSPKPKVDAVVNMMDLPRHLGARPDALPPSPRLSIPEDSRRRAAALVGPYEGLFRIGVVWSGSVTYKANFKRSMDVARFLPLAERPGVQLFSLYKGPLLDEFRAGPLSAGLIVDASGDDRDFADAAALAERMDLIVGADTGVMHLAATLGRPVWNLLAYSPYWLYELERDATPWHPTMRLFRQPSPGDWDAPLAEVGAALDALLAARTGARA